MPFSFLRNTKSMPNLPKRNEMERSYEQFLKEIDRLEELVDTMLHQSRMQRPINIQDLLGPDEYPSKPFLPPYLEYSSKITYECWQTLNAERTWTQLKPDPEPL